MIRQIQKVKYKAGKLDCSYLEITDPPGDEPSMIVEYPDTNRNYEPHDDLIRMLQKFAIHGVLLCEIEVREDEVKDFNWTKYRFNKHHKQFNDRNVVTHLTLGGEGDAEGLTICLKKFVGNGQVVNFKAPFCRFIEDEENPSGYEHSLEMKSLWGEMQNEINQFIDGTKRKPIPVQGALDLQTEPEGDPVEA